MSYFYVLEMILEVKKWDSLRLFTFITKKKSNTKLNNAHQQQNQNIYGATTDNSVPCMPKAGA